MLFESKYLDRSIWYLLRLTGRVVGLVYWQTDNERRRQHDCNDEDTDLHGEFSFAQKKMKRFEEELKNWRTKISQNTVTTWGSASLIPIGAPLFDNIPYSVDSSLMIPMVCWDYCFSQHTITNWFHSNIMRMLQSLLQCQETHSSESKSHQRVSISRQWHTSGTETTV